MGSFVEILMTDLAAALSDVRVWFSVAIALLLGVACFYVGTRIARRVGLLADDALLGEVVGVGLGIGLIVLAATWAAIFSAGMSAYTPVAVGFAIAIALGGHRIGATHQSGRSPNRDARQTAPRRTLLARLAVPAAGCAFIVVVGLLYGVTMAPSPRDGVQPVEFMDEAYYSVLGADLARTGIESIYSPSGFEYVPGLPRQTWYHWGEMWIAAAVITVFGIDPVLARHYVVLPLLLLATAALTGTLVRRLNSTASVRGFLFGGAAALFLAPIPLPGTFFSSWASGLSFASTLYGLGAVVVPLAIYLLAVRPSIAASLGLSIFIGAALASMLPTHIVLSVLALVGAIAVAARQWKRSSRAANVSYLDRRTLFVTGLVATTTILWGFFTGHGIGTSAAAPGVSPFNTAWIVSVLSTTLGAGALVAIPLAAWLLRRESTVRAAVFVGTTALVVFGALAWGARLGDFTMFHVFFGGIAVFGTPAAAAAAWLLLSRLRAKGYRRVAAVAFFACVVQLQTGVLAAVYHMYQFGPHDYEAIPEALLAAVSALPPDAKVAYACLEREEVAFWDPRLVSISAHTGRRVVPMCFQSEVFGGLNGTPLPPEVPSPLFEHAPQRTIYPRHDAVPSDALITAFMKEHGIEYIYADRLHTNVLAPDAISVATSGEFELLQLP